MNKKKLTVLALLMIVILTLTSCVLVACNPDSSDDGNDTATIKETPDLLIKNGDFKVIDTKATTYPRTVTNWTGAKQYSSSDFRDDVTAGVISLEEAYYAANKSTWGDDDGKIRELLLAGNRYGADDKIKNALMIYQPKESKNADEKAINGPTAYGYTSTSFSLEKSSYYKLTVDVLTYNIEGKNEGDVPGARIYVSSNTYAEFAGINTNGKWETYEVYIETSPSASTSLTLMLGLGKYQSYYKTGLTTGYAFFDNVELTKIEDDKSTTNKVEGLEQFNAAHKAQLENGAMLDGKHVTTATLKVPNGNFDFGSTSLSTSGAPSSWSLVTGNSGKDDPAPTSLGYNGIVDLTTLNTKYADLAKEITLASQATNTDNAVKTPYNPAKISLEEIASNIATAPNRIGSNVYMLSSQYMTAQGIRSSRTITIEKNKTYALSVKLYTVAIHGAGVSLILSGSDGKDIVIKGIASNKTNEVLLGTAIIDINNKSYHIGNNPGLTSDGWQTYTFYIQGNQFKDYSYNMTIWLGTEGSNSNTSVKYTSYSSSSSTSETTTYKANGTFSNGFVFIDDLALEEITEGDFNTAAANEANRPGDKDQTLDCSTQNGANYRGIIVDLTSNNLLGEGDDYILNKRAENPSLEGVTTVGAGAPFGWNSQFDATDKSNPVVTDIVSQGVVNIESEDVFNGNGAYPGHPYERITMAAYEISATDYTRYEVETGNITIGANKFYRLSLWVKTIDVSSASGACITLLNKDDEDAELTSFTKVNTKDYDEYYNDWCEITIVIRGAEDKDTNAALRFALGTGNRWASTLTSGSMYVTNLSMTEITYANFNDTSTSTYVKSVNLTESLSYPFTNGEFDNYDHDDENLEGGVALSEQQFAATPEDWTISDSTQAINGKEDEETKEVTSLFAGVIALNPTSEDKLNFTASNQALAVVGEQNQNVFNDFYNYDSTLSQEYLDRLAGPNLLAIGSQNDKKYAIGFASANVSLSSNSYYSISVYAKTCKATTASIFLTGESSATSANDNNNYFVIKNETNANGEWTKYTFFIEVGNTSVSVKLNLWLGLDANYADVDGETEEERLENAKSAGMVFFDHIVQETITEDDYNAATAGATDIKLSFLTDSFDALSTSVESRSELTKPDDWSGATDTSQSSSNTKGGIIYADRGFLEPVNEAGVDYVKILGKEYDINDIEITTEELDEAKASGEYTGTDDEITTALKEKKLLELKKNNWMPLDDNFKAHSGNRMLIINNIENSAYIYTSKSTSFTENSYYKVSVWVRTYAISGEDENDKTVGANVELYLGSANESGNEFIFTGIRADEWTKYEFYVKTRDDSISSITVKLSLGRYGTEEVDGKSVTIGLTKGFAMFDDVAIEKVTESEYENAKAEDEDNDMILTRELSSSTAGTKPGEGETEQPTGSSFNLDYLWWMIPTIVIGLVIIVVVVVMVIRKIKPVAKRAAKKVSSPMSSEMLDTKRNKYDEGKE